MDNLCRIGDMDVVDPFFELVEFISDEPNIEDLTVGDLLERIDLAIQEVVHVDDPTTTCTEDGSVYNTNIRESLTAFITE